MIDRRRELGLLRFLGAASGQIRKLILVEAGLLGLLATFAGVALGFALVADSRFRHQQAIVRLDDSLSLAGGRASRRVDGRVRGDGARGSVSGECGGALESDRGCA